MSLHILMVNVLFNLALMLASGWERKWFWVLYWFGALAINTAVTLIRMRAEGKI